MDHDPLLTEIGTDLFRSAWVVEAGRAKVYEQWTAGDGRYEASRGRSLARAALFAEQLARMGAKPDTALEGPHAGWIMSVAGESHDAVPLGNFLVARLGDWVDKHAAALLPEGGDRVRELGDEERADLQFPSELPTPAEFAALDTPRSEPPGEVIFRFGIIGDLHIGSSYAEEMVRAAVGDMNTSGAELVVQLGDLTDRGNRDEFEKAQKILGTLEMPFATMMGNHDVFSFQEERLSGREYYPASFGREPDGVLLEHKGYRFAVLDSIEHGQSPVGPFDMVSGAVREGPGGGIVRGSITPAQHEILAEVAAPDSPPAFVFLHHPPQPFTGFPPILFGLRDSDSGRLHATVDSGNVWGVFAGHTHRNKTSDTYGVVPIQEVGVPRDFPFGYALVDVTATGYAYNFVQVSDVDLLRSAYARAPELFRRYAAGSTTERSFVWTRGLPT